MKFTFTLNEEDLTYFKRLLRDARRYAKGRDESEIITSVRELVAGIRRARRIPAFMEDALSTLQALTEMVEDKDFKLPRAQSSAIVAALAYFAHPEDLIPDDIPGLGFLDDAIMLRLVAQEFKPELWGYRKFRKFRDRAEQRPWTKVARERTASRLALKRKEILTEVARRRTRSKGFEIPAVGRWRTRGRELEILTEVEGRPKRGGAAETDEDDDGRADRLYWNTRFPDDPVVRDQAKISINRVVRIETAIEPAADSRAARSSAIPRTKLPVGELLSFELEALWGLEARLAGSSDGFASFVRAGAFEITTQGTEVAAFELQGIREGSAHFELTLIARGSIVSRQVFDLEVVDVPDVSAGLPIPQEPSDELSDDVFDVPQAELRFRFRSVDNMYTFSVHRGDEYEELTPYRNKDYIATQAINARNELVQLSRMYQAPSTVKGADLAIESPGDALVKFAKIGGQMHQALFGAPGDQNVSDDLRRVAHTIAAHGRRGVPRLQIDAPLLAFPWGLLYDARDYAEITSEPKQRERYASDPEDTDDVDISCFWGYRFRIDRAAPGRLRPSRRNPRVNEPRVRLCINRVLNKKDALGTADRQSDFFRELEQKRQCRLLRPEIDSSETFESLIKDSEEGPSELLYFFCHAKAGKSVDGLHAPTGELPEDMARILLDRGEGLSISGMRALRTSPLEGEPLVFMNACESTQADPAYPCAFVEHFRGTWGARGFIGTDWEVPTVFADAFGRRVLRLMLEGRLGIGKAFSRVTREALEDFHNPFGLIYGLYSRPDLTLRPEST